MNMCTDLMCGELKYSGLRDSSNNKNAFLSVFFI